jgi:UDP-N-acetylglucosamine 2-epimerase
MNKYQLMTIFGVRLEIIHISRIMAQLDVYKDHCMVHTGHHYDYRFNDILFSDLCIDSKNHFLNFNRK